MTEQFLFDSEGMEPEAAFGAYRRLYGQGSDVQRGQGPFAARVRAVRFDGLILFDRRITGVVHSRETRAVSDGFDHFALHLILSGTLLGSHVSGFDVAGALDLVIADTTRPSRNEALDAHILTASIPRISLAAACSDMSSLHGRRIVAPRTLILRDMMLSLLNNADQMDIRAMPGLRRTFVELLASLLHTEDGTASGAARLDISRREAALRFIAAHLQDRDLDVGKIATGLSISRSMLYRLFARDGGVAEVIMQRRLSAVRDALEGGNKTPLATLAIQHGFADESHLNRRFTRAYGQPAGAFRRAVADNDTDPVSVSTRRWAGWMDEVG